MLTRVLGADPVDLEDRPMDIEYVTAGVRVRDLTGELVYDPNEDNDDEDEDDEGDEDEDDDYEGDEDEVEDSSPSDV